MKYLLIALTLFTANAAKAEVFTCYQTEPFISEVYNVEKGTLKITEEVMKETKTLRNLKLVIKGEGRFEIRNAANKTIRVMILNNQGSDGMSDRIYPYSGTSINGTNSAGCESSELKATNE